MHPPNVNMDTISTFFMYRAKAIHEESRSRYQIAESSAAYWAMIDLVSSASFRVLAGDLKAFARFGALSGIVKEIIDPYSNVTCFKELGDALLLRSTSFRSLAEIACVFDSVSRYWNGGREGDNDSTLSTRMVVTFGECVHAEGDYFGSPLDKAARLSGDKTGGENQLMLVTDEVRFKNQVNIAEELPFLQFTTTEVLDSSNLKPGEQRILVSRVVIDRGEFKRFRDYFEPLRKLYADSIEIDSRGSSSVR